MESLNILIPLVLIIVVFAIMILLWAINNDQFDDLDLPAQSVLFDDKNDNKTAD